MKMSRDYLGYHICENDTLVYTETPVGFIKNDTIYAYVKDYRGNVRSVIDEFGNVAETNLFYPYGGLMTDDTQPSVSVQMRKFEGKEFDREYGQNVYDYHARMYDPYLCGFNSRDPQAEKYPDISPYAFCAANPNRFIDPTGEDIAVLFLGNGEHLALLIQNENKKWEYFSLNGINIYNYTQGSYGGNNHHNIGEKEFDSPSDFLNSEFNSIGKKEQKESDETSGYEYQVSYIIPTNTEQDKKMKQSFLQSAEKGYDLITNNCAHAVQHALNAGGIEFKKTIFNIQTSLIKVSLKYVPSLPSTTFKFIKENYPYGREIKK